MNTWKYGQVLLEKFHLIERLKDNSIFRKIQFFQQVQASAVETIATQLERIEMAKPQPLQFGWVTRLS